MEKENMKLIENLITSLFIISSQLLCFGQQQSYIQYSINDGLPSENVYMAFQDSKGFMWFGTDAGLSRFNGYSFENFSLQDGLVDNDIFDILEDKKGRIWFATNNGKLCYFKDHKFHSSDNDLILNGYDFNSYISCIYEDTQGNIWFGSKTSGIIYLDTSNKFHKIQKSDYHKNEQREPATFAIWENSSKEIFALTGITIENLSTKTTVLLNDLGIKIGLGNIYQVKVLPFAEGDLLISENGNFHLINLKTEKLLRSTNFGSLKSTSVFLSKDKFGNFWAGNFKGIFKTNYTLIENAEPVDFLKNLTVTSRKVDNNGGIWYTTLQEGVFYLPANATKNYTIGTGLPEKVVNTVTGNKFGDILLGQNEYYSFIINDKITSYTDDPSYEGQRAKRSYAQKICNVSLYNDGQYFIASNYGLTYHINDKNLYYSGDTKTAIIYKDNSILFGSRDIVHTNVEELSTAQSNTDYYLNSKNKNYYISYYNHFKNRLLKDSRVNELYWDESSGVLWIGLNNELLYLKDGKTIKLSSKHSALGAAIKNIIESDNNGVWVATHGYGIIKLNRNGDPTHYISTIDGLSSNLCNALALDKDGNLWVATNLGLNKIEFLDSNVIFSQYGIGDGLLSNNINDIHIHNEKIFVATDEGLSVMEINKADSYQMPIYITNTEVNGITKFSNKRKNTLTYDQNNLSFDFVALDYRMIGKMSYRYKIKNDQDWNYTTNNKVEFSSLSPEDYVFIVQAKNKQGNWSNQTVTAAFTITPPFWLTWWAYVVYFLLAAGGIYRVFKYELKRRLLTSELQLEKKESSKIKELEKLKSQFFSNISHEFRTPLTLILGPLERVINKIKDSSIKRQLQMVNRNALGLLHLINQLLDISKLESGKLTLHYENKDVASDLGLIGEPFVTLAEQKGLQFEVNRNFEELTLQYDPKMMEIIINNLLSNAMKFTQKGGKVSFDVLVDNNESNMLTICVSDTGIGITEKNLPYVFERFYQVDSTVSREYEGTGIGLSLTKELVELHNGSISVESQEGVGSSFTIKIPIVIGGVKSVSSKSTVEEVKTTENPYQIITNNNDKTTTESTILVVEDNDEMRMYLEDILAEKYYVVLAENGEIGIEKAKKTTPDLILSDVMMPKLSGIELCRYIKENELTSHIPVVLLTAKSATESKVEGFEIGADAYITKPFSHLELLAQIKNLISQRKKLRERFKLEPDILPKEIAATSIDQQFLQRALDIVDENISNSDFSVTTFSKEFGASREHMTRKLKGLTGLTTSEFIRTHRLKKATVLLIKKSATVAEVGYQVGFSDPAYFSRCFTEVFGVTPSKYTLS